MIPIFNIPKISRKLSTSSTVQLDRMRVLVKSIQSPSLPLNEQVDPFANLSKRERKKLKRPGSIWKVLVAAPGRGAGSDWKPLDGSPYPMTAFDHYTQLGDSNYFVPLPKETIFSVFNTFLASDAASSGIGFSDFIEKNFGEDVSHLFFPYFALYYTQQGDDFIIDNPDEEKFLDDDDNENELDSDFSMYFEFVQDVP